MGRTDLVVESASQQAEEPVDDERPSPRTAWFPRLARSPATIAILAWLVGMPLAYAIPRLINVDPFSERGGFLPLGVGGVLLVLTTAAAWRRRAGEWVAASAAGLFAAWVALAFRAALYGTPYGTTGLHGDRVRVAAAAMRNTTTVWPADSFIDGLPAEYPPLFPWLVAKGAQLVDVPTWRLLTVAEVVLLSFAVLAAFLMWRRLVPAPVALVLSASGVLVYGDPRKAFAVATLFVFIPWVISAFSQPSRGRLHWLPAGVIGGLIMLTYNGWFPFGTLGVLAIIGWTWWQSADRAGYLRRVLLTGAVAAVVAAPYLVPLGWGLLTSVGQTVSDEYTTPAFTLHNMPFLKPTLLGALQLIGLAGLIWYRRRTEWARPMLYLLIGAYLFWLIMGIRFLFTEHTALFFYVQQVTSTVLLAAAVLTLVQAGPALARRFALVPPYRTGAVVTAVAMLWVGFTYWQDWRPLVEPGLGGTTNSFSAWAHLEPLPDCTYPRYAPTNGRFDCYPVNQIKAEVERVLGPGARPNILASDERLFAFVAWPAYMAVDRTAANTLSRWDDRFEEVKRMARMTDPAEFAKATADNKFGRIDVITLHKVDDQHWSSLWVRFDPRLFDPAFWTVVEGLPTNTVVAIRR